MTTEPATPLLLTADPLLESDLLRLAAAAGVGLDVRTDPDRAARAWAASPLVLVGADRATAAVAAALPRRGQVLVVAPGAADDRLYRAAVELGATSVVELPASDGWLVEVLSDVVDEVHDQGTVVAVVGGSGGVGATVLTAALALTAGRNGRALAVDLDPLGPGLRRTMGVDEATGVTWRELADSRGRLGSRALRESLPGIGDVRVLGHAEDDLSPPGAAVVREALSAGRRGHDWVVVDLPRAADPRTAPVLGGCDRVVLVARAALGTVASAGRVADRLRGETPSLGLVVRTRGGTASAREVARAVGVELMGELPEQRRLDEHLDLGLGPVHARRSPLARTARELLDRLAVR
jgi:secretion/DNA translocation related CpaE-like protein